MRHPTSRLFAVRALAARFARDGSGLAAIEFAMMLPLMVTLYFGVVEISQAVSIDRKMALTARTVGDLVAQCDNITPTDMTNILQASSTVAAPFPLGPLKVKVAGVTIDGSKKATVTWSDASGTTGRATGTTLTTAELPTGLRIANTMIIFTETSYDYKPAIGYIITGTLKLTDQSFMRPRLHDTITRLATPACGST